MKIYVSTIVEKDNKYLLIREAKDSCYGKWNIPSGRVEENEYILNAAVREIKEETNLDVDLTGLISVYNNMFDGFNSIAFIFVSNITKLNSIEFEKKEILEAKWFSLDELKNMKDELRDYEYITNSIEKLIKKDIKPLDTIIVR